MGEKLSIWRRIKQRLCAHVYTTPFQRRGNIPDAKRVAEIGIWKSWVEDNHMSCLKCGHVSHLSEEFEKSCEAINKKDLTDDQKISEAFIHVILRKPVF